MPPARDARPVRLLLRASVLAVVAAACTPADSRPAPPAPVEAEAPEPPPASPPPGRTANQDLRSFDNQPDYDREAALLKEQVLPRLPDPLPPGRKQACAAMLSAADALYREIDPDPGSQGRTLLALQSTRPADLAACERETSVRAAACVTVLLGDRTAELPWLLDQCSRAFPE